MHTDDVFYDRGLISTLAKISKLKHTIDPHYSSVIFAPSLESKPYFLVRVESDQFALKGPLLRAQTSLLYKLQTCVQIGPDNLP